MPPRTTAPRVSNECITLRGARMHNLKNLSVSLPHNKLTVVTGVSGSGKSSLVFDTIYAEGQRRYVESLSTYARQFVDRMEKPALDEIEGIAPPVAIRQKNTTRNPRSTVATSTEIYDYLRLLFARAGRTYCPHCGNRVERDTVDHVAARMLSCAPGSRWYALFPLAPHTDPKTRADYLFELRKRGFNRLFQKGTTYEFSTPESLIDIDFSQPVYALIDRLALPQSGASTSDLRQRVVDAVEIAYREAREAHFQSASGEETLRFSEVFSCKIDDTKFADPEPSLFSFNSPMGACPRCQGFGNVVDYDPDLVIPDPYLALEKGAVDPWNKPQYRWG